MGSSGLVKDMHNTFKNIKGGHDLQSVVEVSEMLSLHQSQVGKTAVE